MFDDDAALQTPDIIVGIWSLDAIPTRVVAPAAIGPFVHKNILSQHTAFRSVKLLIAGQSQKFYEVVVGGNPVEEFSCQIVFPFRETLAADRFLNLV